MQYPKAWERFAAAFVDWLLYSVFTFAFFFLLLTAFTFGSLAMQRIVGFLAMLATTFLVIGYKVLFESGALQATPGKLLFGPVHEGLGHQRQDRGLGVISGAGRQAAEQAERRCAPEKPPPSQAHGSRHASGACRAEQRKLRCSPGAPTSAPVPRRRSGLASARLVLPQRARPHPCAQASASSRRCSPAQPGAARKLTPPRALTTRCHGTPLPSESAWSA